MKARLTLGPGTHAIRGGLRSAGDWFHDGSDFCARAFDHGLACSYFPWPTALGGIAFWKTWVGQQPDLGDWEIPALNLKERFQPEEVNPIYWPRQSRINIITHSHGAQPTLIAAALGLKIGVLVTVSAPIRADVLFNYGEHARKNIAYHLEYFSVEDRIQMAGGLGDGHFGVMRRFGDYQVNGRAPYAADECITMPEPCGHSGLLHDVKYMSELETAFQRILDRDGRDDLCTRAA
jgi:hypothetical protein